MPVKKGNKLVELREVWLIRFNLSRVRQCPMLVLELGQISQKKIIEIYQDVFWSQEI